MLEVLHHNTKELIQRFRTELHALYTPRVPEPWSSSVCRRVGREDAAAWTADMLFSQLFSITQHCSKTLSKCTDAAQSFDVPQLESFVHGSWIPCTTIDIKSPCFVGRFVHKLIVLLRWILRVMGPEWAAKQFVLPGDVSKDEFGSFMTVIVRNQAGERPMLMGLAYLELSDPDTGLPMLVPLANSTYQEWTDSSWARCATLVAHLGCEEMKMVIRGGMPVLDRGLCLTASASLLGGIHLTAVSGRTGRASDRASDSFTVAPVECYWRSEEALKQSHESHLRNQQLDWVAAITKEIEKRKRPDYFHIIHAIRQMIPAVEWPSTPDETLFIATPQRGIESELVALSLLESLAEDAAAGNAQAQLLIAHIKAECAAPIAEVIAQQKSRLDQMLEDQAEQLRIHAEAVKRAELRGRIKGPTAVEDGGSAASSAASSTSVSSSAASAALTDAASSSAGSEALSSSSTHGPAFSWTQSREFQSVASLREPGRLKYRTIMSAAKKLLYSLNPVRVNKTGGSHLVFHFASGSPATLVQMHAGGRSKDSTAYSTRLYAQLSEVAAAQLLTTAVPAADAVGAGGPSAQVTPIRCLLILRQLAPLCILDSPLPLSPFASRPALHSRLPPATPSVLIPLRWEIPLPLPQLPLPLLSASIL